MKHQFRKFILFSSLLSTTIIACNRDNDINKNAPAYQIAESEKLVIPAAIDLPANAPAGNSRVATFYAEGVQKYKAQAKAGGGFEWIFVAPQADLYDAANKKIGTHSAGPTWQITGTTDTIYAQQFAPAKTAPSPEALSIDWLQLMPKVGKTPTGIFANVSYVQRIATKGGKAPAQLPTSVTETIDVHYTAVYRFTKKN